MLRKITKVKIHDTEKADVTYNEILDDEGTIKDGVTREGGRKAHPDLIEAFKALDIHFATLCEQGTYTEFEDDATKLVKFHTTHVIIGGDEDTEGVTLTGKRKLANSKILNLNAPFVKFKDSEYIYMSSLEALIRHVLLETDQYLNGTKVAPTAQLDLFGPKDDDNDDEDDAPAPTEVKKNGKHKALKLDKTHPLMEEMPEPVNGLISMDH